MRARSDLKRYEFACEEIQNFFPSVQGPAIKRSGTRFIRSAIDASSKSRLFQFEFSDNQSYVLELSEGKMRVYRNSGAVLETAENFTAAPTATSTITCEITGHPYSTGESVYITGSGMAELNGRFFEITKTGADTFTLDGEVGTGRTTGTGGSAARHYEIEDGVASNSLPWLEDELDAIQFAQNGDLMYLAHPNHPPHVITRAGNTDWTCVEMTFKFLPLSTANLDETMKVSVDDCSVGTLRTVAATGFTFSASDVGRVLAVGVDPAASDFYAPWVARRDLTDINFSVGDDTSAPGTGTYRVAEHRVTFEGRVYSGDIDNTGFGSKEPKHEEGTERDGNVELTYVSNGWGYGTITAQSSTTATITIDVELPANIDTGNANATGSASDQWAWGAWDEVNGYPAAVAFYEDRLWFGGTTAEPQTVWGSRTGIYNDFRITPAETDDTGVQFKFLSQTLNKIEWLQGGDVLYAGTRGGEFVVDSGSQNAGITPSTVRVRRQSNYGSKVGIQPRAVDASLVFARSNDRLHDLSFEFESDRYVAPDLTRFADDHLRPGVTMIDYQRDPFRLLWALRSDGTAAVATYDKLEDVIGWGDVVIGGTTAAIESIAVIPHPDGDEDQVWMSVVRTIGGSPVRHIEILEKAFVPGTDIEDAFFVDCGLTYDDTSTTTISGLWHLEGEDVTVLADGYEVEGLTVSDGAITLGTAASVVHIGLPMGSAQIKTLPWSGNSSTLSTAATVGWPGRISSFLILVETMGEAIEYGPEFTYLDTWSRRPEGYSATQAVPLYTGYSPILELATGVTGDRQICLRHNVPLPCTVLAIVGRSEVEVR